MFGKWIYVLYCEYTHALKYQRGDTESEHHSGNEIAYNYVIRILPEMITVWWASEGRLHSWCAANNKYENVNSGSDSGEGSNNETYEESTNENKYGLVAVLTKLLWSGTVFGDWFITSDCGLLLLLLLPPTQLVCLLLRTDTLIPMIQTRTSFL